jgi:hypothetical protein
MVTDLGSPDFGLHPLHGIHDYADLCVMPTGVRSPLWRRESRLMGSA